MGIGKKMLEFSKKKGLSVQFNVCVYILVSLVYSVPLLQFFRKFEEGVFEMTCTLNIDANLLKYPLGYKYVLYSPRVLQENDCFEYLHSFAGQWHHQDPNRCLRINPSDLESM